MSSSLLRPAHRLLSGVLATALLASNLAFVAPRALAESPPGPASGASAGAAAESSPTVVGELEASRTADSSTFALSDGSLRTEIYTEPVHYRDPSGQWQDVDPTLVPTPEYGRVQTRATGLTETFGSGDSTAAPVEVSDGRWGLGMKLIGAEESDPFALGDQAVFPLAQTGTELAYQSRSNGVKDTLVLSSPAAPDTFTFFLTLSGLDIFAEPGTGAWVLYDAEKHQRVGRMEPLTVADSRGGIGAAGAATCPDASMSVTPVAGGAYVTYRIPRAWLGDPARVYPVMVDPSVTFQGIDDTMCDTYVAKGDSSYHWGDTHLDASLFGSGDLRRALINFGLGPVVRGSTINSAILQTYLWQNSSSGHSTTNCQPALGAWSYNATWANTFGNGSVSIGTGGDYDGLDAGTDQYAFFDVTGVVRRWTNGSLPNNGFVLYSNNESAVCQHSFYSAEYTTHTSHQPHLVVDYTAPTISADPLPDKVHAGDLVTISTHVHSTIVTNVQAKLDGRLANGSTVTTARFAYTTQPPAGDWVSVPLSSGGYISYLNTDYNTSSTPAIIPDLSASSATKTGDGYDIDFAFRVGPGHSQIAANRLSVVGVDWTNAWQDTGYSYQAVASPVTTASVQTTASADYYDESATATAGATQGRGSVALAWASDPLASGYGIYLFDGNVYRQVATSTVPSWSSAGKQIYPSDAAISALASGYPGNAFAAGTLDLRDDPRPLYAKSPGTVWDSVPAYAFKVAPFNASGAAPLSDCATIPVALCGRTLHIADEPRHAEADLGSLAGDDAAARLDRGDLVLRSTDLSIPGLGPDVTVSRTYHSSSTTTTTLAPGWRFGFDAQLTGTDSTATLTDAAGDAHVFRRLAGGWVAPHGDADKLTGDSAHGFQLTHKDRSTTTFDATGRLTAEADAFGNTVRYEWSSDGTHLVIRAPTDVPLLHERRITLELQGGRVMRATAHAGADVPDRVVTYSAGSGRLTVTQLPGTDSEHTTVYTYDSSGRISRIAVPGFQPSQNGEAGWKIGYGDGALVTVSNDTGGATPRAPLRVSWDASARIGWVASATGTRTIGVDRLGEIVSATEENTSAATVDTYDVEGDRIEERSPSGRTTRSVFDGRGNELVSTDELGASTERTFANDLCVEEHDPQGSVTRRTFDPATGALLTEESDLNDAGDRSHVDYAYNADGTMSRERHAQTATLTAETDYTDYAECGQPRTTSQPNIETAPGIFATLTKRATYDSWGDKLMDVDALGTTVASNAYDAAGRLIESADASGTISHQRYNVLGGEAKRWRSNPSTSTIADWNETVLDGLGNPTTEIRRASDGTTVSVTAHSYDDAGRETTSDCNTVPGAAVTKYDAQSNVSQAWAEGADTGTSAASDRLAFDADGEVRSTTAPGATTASDVTSYTADGQVASQLAADGALVTNGYDDAGDLTTQTARTDAGGASTAFENDLDGRVVGVVDAAGTTETTTYDLDGHELASGVSDGSQDANRYNALGWLLEHTDSDAAVTRYAYDADGRMISSTTGGATTTCRYDGCGRLFTQTGPDGASTHHDYSVFGDEIATVDFAGGSTLRCSARTIDGAGRVETETTTILGGQQSRTVHHTFAADGGETAAESRQGGVLVLTTHADGNHTTRSVAGQLGAQQFAWSVASTDSAGRVTSFDATGLAGLPRRTWSQTGQLLSSRACSSAADYAYSAVTGSRVHDTHQFVLGGRTKISAYAYDLEGRLATSTVNGVVTTYRYDPTTGALLAKGGDTPALTLSYESSGTGRLTSSGTRTFGYDSQGHRTWSANGSASPDTSYVWSGERLVSATTSRGAATYVYDADGQRVRSTVTTGGSTTTSVYDYDENRLDGLTASRSDGTSWTVEYFYDDSQRLLGGAYADASRTALFLAETDARGDVCELLDANGRAFALYDYDALGAPCGLTATATPGISAILATDIANRQPVRFASYVYDGETGLYYCGARYYDAATDSFLSKDPQSADGALSPYLYCADDPIDHTDPSGCDVWEDANSQGVGYYNTLSRGEYIIVRWCRWKVGQKYVFGAKAAPGKEWKKGPIDCSGLTAAAYRLAHKLEKKVFPTLPDGSYNQHDDTKSLGFKLGASKLKIGDLGFLHTGGKKTGKVHHVAIYIGLGVVVEARGKKWGVVETKLKDFNNRGADWHRARKH